MTTDEQLPDADFSGASLAQAIAQPLTLGRVCRQTLDMARESGWCLMQPLLPPVGKMLLGLYSSLVFSLLFTQWVTQPAYLEFTLSHRELVIAAVLGICLLCLLLFFQGCWEYLVYWASLCRNVQALLAGRPLDILDIKDAYVDVAHHKKAIYVRWLGLLCVLPVVPLLPVIGLPLLGAQMSASNPMAALGLTLAGFLLGGILGVAWLVAQLLLTYGFQVLALEDVSTGLIPVLKRSSALTLKRFWLTLALQVGLFLATNYVLTLPVVFFLRFARLLTPLDDLNGWLGAAIMGNVNDALQQVPMASLSGQLLAHLQADKLSLAQGVTDAVASAGLSMLLLPLGTIALTLVYLHWRAQENSWPEGALSANLDVRLAESE